MNASAWIIHAVRWLAVACFAVSMPMDFLNGHGPGWLADPAHFQGYEVIRLSLYLQARGGTFGFAAVAAASALVPLVALVNFSKCPPWVVVFPATIAALAIWFLAGWDEGVFAGVLVWSISVSLACTAMLLECWRRPSELTARRQFVNWWIVVLVVSGIVPFMPGHIVDGEVSQRMPPFLYYFAPSAYWPMILLHVLAGVGLAVVLMQLAGFARRCQRGTVLRETSPGADPHGSGNGGK